MSISIKEALNKFFEDKNYEEKIKLGYLHEYWEDIVGKEITKATEIIKVKKDILYIKTSNPAWRTELSFRKEKIKEELLEKDNNIKIKDIKFL